MTEQDTEAAPVATSDGPAETTNLLSEALEATEGQASPEQTETSDATDGESQGEQAGAPESYEFTAPEGVTIEQDSAVIAAFSDHAKSLNLTQEQAQEQFSKLATAQADAAKAQHAALVESWANETRKHPTLGGENLQATMVKAAQSLATFDANGEAKALLTETGLINHPAIISLLVQHRDAISDDRFVAGNPAEEKPRERTAKDFFGLPELK